MRELLGKLLRDEEAPTAIEYVIMVSGIAVVIVSAVWLFGGIVRDSFDNAAKQLRASH